MRATVSRSRLEEAARRRRRRLQQRAAPVFKSSSSSKRRCSFQRVVRQRQLSGHKIFLAQSMPLSKYSLQRSPSSRAAAAVRATVSRCRLEEAARRRRRRWLQQRAVPVFTRGSSSKRRCSFQRVVRQRQLSGHTIFLAQSMPLSNQSLQRSPSSRAAAAQTMPGPELLLYRLHWCVVRQPELQP